MKLINGSTVPALLAVLPCSISSILSARAVGGDASAVMVMLALLALAGLAVARDHRHGSWNIMALAYLFGFPIGLAAGFVQL